MPDSAPDLLEQSEPPEEDQTESLADIVGVDLVPVSVGSIPVMPSPDGPVVALRHAVQEMGLSYPRAWRTLRARRWATVAQRATVTRDGRRLQMVVVDVRTFIMWLATVDENRVTDLEVRNRVIAFQNEAADVLHNYWTRGVAVNPRGRTPRQVELVEQAAAGLLGPVLAALGRGHYHLQVATGRRDMPSGLPPTGPERATARAKVQQCLAEAYTAALDAGLEAAAELDDDGAAQVAR